MKKTISQKGADELEEKIGRKFIGLILESLVDFDALYWHRRDVKGYNLNKVNNK